MTDSTGSIQKGFGRSDRGREVAGEWSVRWDLAGRAGLSSIVRVLKFVL